MSLTALMDKPAFFPASFFTRLTIEKALDYKCKDQLEKR